MKELCLLVLKLHILWPKGARRSSVCIMFVYVCYQWYYNCTYCVFSNSLWLLQCKYLWKMSGHIFILNRDINCNVSRHVGVVGIILHNFEGFFKLAFTIWPLALGMSVYAVQHTLKLVCLTYSTYLHCNYWFYRQTIHGWYFDQRVHRSCCR